MFRLMRYGWFWILLLMVGGIVAQEAESTEEPIEIPPPLPLVDEGEADILNVLLMGSATENPNNPGLTDTLIVVSINRTDGQIALLSIPRDLYVHIPGFAMGKINQAYYYGETRSEDYTGLELLYETIRYNLGLEIDHYARVNFLTFGSLIDALGGITISVDCIIEDWKLIDPELDKDDPDNWEMYTLWSGVHHMDGELALWYVRSRRTSSDLDRNRRQQDVLRAIWHKIEREGVLENLPAIWDEVMETVETDMTLPDMLGLLPLAVEIDTADLRYYTFKVKEHINGDISPEGMSVLMMERDAVQNLLQEVVLPPTHSQIRRQIPTVAIANASAYGYLSRVAADRLELEGFRTIIVDEPQSPRQYNHIIDYTGDSKGSRTADLQRTLRVTDEGVAVEPNPDREYDYKVILGANYQFYACTRPVIQPEYTPEDEAADRVAGGD